jgi:hypothetical protein
MAHARRHEKKEWLKTLTKLCNMDTTGKARKQLDKELERHDQKVSCVCVCVCVHFFQPAVSSLLLLIIIIILSLTLSPPFL